MCLSWLLIITHHGAQVKQVWVPLRTDEIKDMNEKTTPARSSELSVFWTQANPRSYTYPPILTS